MTRRPHRKRADIAVEQACAKRIIVSEDGGIPCPRCAKPTQIREHVAITDKLLRQPFYYRRWFFCTNPVCKTKMIMVDADRVWCASPTSSPPQIAPDPLPLPIIWQSADGGFNVEIDGGLIVAHNIGSFSQAKQIADKIDRETLQRLVSISLQLKLKVAS